MILDGTPFVEYRTQGPHFDRAKGRWRIYIFTADNVRQRTNYARYVWAKYKGVWPKANEEVDHKDGDRQNDSIENLQLLTTVANKRKYVTTEVVGDYVDLCCPACECVFTRLLATTHLNHTNNRMWTACSIVCAHAIRKMYGSIFRSEFEGNVIRVFKATFDKENNAFIERQE
jgi:hypothetical protein